MTKVNREEFIGIINGRVPADRHVIGEVNDIISMFPYFQSAHMLLLKALSSSSDVRFDTQLGRSAIYVADRERLYYYIHGLSAEKIEETVSQPDTAPIEDAAVASAAAAQPEPEREPAVNLMAPEPEELLKEEGHPILIQADSDTGEEPGIMVIHENVTNVTNNGDEMADTAYESESDTELLELIDEEEFNTMQEARAREESRSRKEVQNELIDRFIIANPRIEPSREKSDQLLEDLSSASSEISGTYVTDTLAQIYIHQGYYSRAIEIYEKLCLKYPEKSSYFAAQIEKVKELLKK